MIPKFVKAWNNASKFTVRNLLNSTNLGTFTNSFTDLVEPSAAIIYRLELA